jgi:DNA-binding IclR family transcriptional regulator
MLFLDGVYVGEVGSSARFRWVKAPTSAELTQLTHTIAHRLARYLERQGLLERDAEHSYWMRWLLIGITTWREIT